MPTYDYLCNNCEHTFEKFQSITAGTLRKCPECGKMLIRRVGYRIRQDNLVNGACKWCGEKIPGVWDDD